MAALIGRKPSAWDDNSWSYVQPHTKQASMWKSKYIAHYFCLAFSVANQVQMNSIYNSMAPLKKFFNFFACMVILKNKPPKQYQS